jgi:hypothetical protein
MPVSLTVQRGARETLETRHRLRIESGRVRLIGIDSYRDDRATGNGTRASTNLLTGLRETEVLRAQRLSGRTARLFRRARATWKRSGSEAASIRGSDKSACVVSGPKPVSRALATEDMLHGAYVRETQLRPGGELIVRIAGEGRWLLPSRAEKDLRLLDNAVTLAVYDVRKEEYQRLLVGLCAFVRLHGELLDTSDHAGDADITIPPPDMPLDSAVDALFDARGLSAESNA